MTSRTTARFRASYAELPDAVRERARAAYRLFQHDAHHPSLHFKQIHPRRPIYSARVGLGYRARVFTYRRYMDELAVELKDS